MLILGAEDCYYNLIRPVWKRPTDSELDGHVFVPAALAHTCECEIRACDLAAGLRPAGMNQGSVNKARWTPSVWDNTVRRFSRLRSAKAGG
ncbi:hypothetical protein SMMN14_02391 [Sphaerulina musiva]